MALDLKGFVDKIIFRNADNGYTVFNLISSPNEIEITCVGTFTFINEGEYIEMEGAYIDHQIYGQQFQMESYEVKEPEDLLSMERYLGSGAIKGVGAIMAAKIVKYFKEDTFRILEEEPERLSEVKGISERKAREIAEQFEEKRDMRGAMLFLQQYGISNNLAVKIYKEYGSKMYDVIRSNPYRLAEDISGVGFKIADEIAVRAGISSSSDYRIRAGILYVLLQATNNGHTYLPEEVLMVRTCELLQTPIDEDTIRGHIVSLVIDKKLVAKELEGKKCIYSASYYYMELNSARMMCDLNIKCNVTTPEIEKHLKYIETTFEIELDEMQRMAVIEAARNGVLILTGGPGTGKTTTINAIIRFFETQGMDILLAAPTGRAAKRMQETTGQEARTIHRLLELSKVPEMGDNRFVFERNESNPLETDVVIIDEMSMVDIALLNSLLKAVMVGTRLILVGDVNQLPSVGPGNVLKDLIASHQFNVVKLTKIFRQASESDIIVNAHKINDGQPIQVDNKSKDFFLLKRGEPAVITSVIVKLIHSNLPKYVNASKYDIQVLTPMRKGELGVEKLNQVLQDSLNPRDDKKKEKEYHQTIFREGDKVMQIKNNYQLAWEIKSRYGITVESGMGVFNGDAGIIKEINLFAEQLLVEFDEGKMVTYAFTQLDELELAYAITIHKSQGSEYPAVILPLLNGPKMLLTRNLLYTAVTRAKSCVTIVGSDRMVQLMIDNESEQKRYTSLAQRIIEIRDIDGQTTY